MAKPIRMRLSNAKIQKKLLNTGSLTFEKTRCSIDRSIVNSMEMARRNAQEFHPMSSDSNQARDVHKALSVVKRRG